EQAPRSIYSLGHTGEVERDVFQQLAAAKPAPQLEVGLVRGELQQAFVEIQAPADAKPGDFVVAEILQLARRGKKTIPVGGLAVVLRVASDEVKRKRGAAD